MPGLQCSTAGGIFPDQGSNPCLLHWPGRFFTTEAPVKPDTDPFWCHNMYNSKIFHSLQERTAKIVLVWFFFLLLLLFLSSSIDLPSENQLSACLDPLFLGKGGQGDSLKFAGPLSWNFSWNSLDPHWERPWCWERLKAGGEGDYRGWDEMVGWHHQLHGPEFEFE